MKKLLLLVLSLVVFCSVFLGCNTAQDGLRLSAEPTPGITLGLSSFNVGNYYDFKSERIYGGVEASIINIKNVMSIDIGLLTNGSRQAPLVAAAFNLIGICNKFGWEYKLPSNIEIVGFYSRNFFYESQIPDPSEPIIQKWFAGVGLVIVLPINAAPATTP